MQKKAPQVKLGRCVDLELLLSLMVPLLRVKEIWIQIFCILTKGKLHEFRRKIRTSFGVTLYSNRSNLETLN